MGVDMTTDAVDTDARISKILDFHRTLASNLNPNIRVYLAPGVNDIGWSTSMQHLDNYSNFFGDSYYHFTVADTFGVVLNSSLIFDPFAPEELAQRQDKWLSDVLSDANLTKSKEIVVFCDRPLIPVESTGDVVAMLSELTLRIDNVLEKLETAGVKYSFHGGLNKNGVYKIRKVNEVVVASSSHQIERNGIGAVVGVRREPGGELKIEWH